MQNNKVMIKNFKKNIDQIEEFKLRFVLIPFIFVTYSIYYDLVILKQPLYQNGYVYFKTFFLVFPFCLYLLRNKQSRKNIFYYSLYWILYSFYHVKYVSLIYNTAFIQTSVAFSIMVLLTGVEFIIFSLLMIIGSSYSILTTEKVMFYITNNQAAKTDILINSICLQGLCYLVYYYMTLPKLKVTTQEKKLASFGKTTSFIMHEMEKPLRRINQDPSNIENEVRNLQEVFQISKMLNESISSLIEIEDVDLGKTYSEVSERYEKIITNLEVKICLNSTNPVVRSNKKYLMLIIDNLLRNAIEEVKNHSSKTIDVFINNDFFVITNQVESKIINPSIFGTPMNTSKIGHMGVGLFICKTLSDKLVHQIDFKFQKDTFTAAVRF